MSIIADGGVPPPPTLQLRQKSQLNFTKNIYSFWFIQHIYFIYKFNSSLYFINWILSNDILNIRTFLFNLIHHKFSVIHITVNMRNIYSILYFGFDHNYTCFYIWYIFNFTYTFFPEDPNENKPFLMAVLGLILGKDSMYMCYKIICMKHLMLLYMDFYQ